MAKVFVSYRRRDSAALAGHLCERLKSYYGHDNVFMDVHDLDYGPDYRTQLESSLSKSDIVLALIGPQWLGTENEASRIMNDDDPVRLEIEFTLKLKRALLPVLLEGARMPEPSMVPPSLESLTYANAVNLHSGVNFNVELKRVITAIDALLGEDAPTVPQGKTRWNELLRQPGLWLAVAAAFLPLSGIPLKISPPWPAGSEMIASCLCLMVLFSLITVLQHGSLRQLAGMTKALAAVACVAAIAYFIAFSMLVFSVPTTGDRYVKGFVCTADAQLVYAKKCPFLGQDELRSAEYESERLWTTASVSAARSILFVLWICVAVALCGVCASLCIVSYGKERRTHYAVAS